MAGTIVTDRIESDASYASSITVASPMVIANTISMTNGNITGNVNIDNGTLFVDSVGNKVGIGTTTPSLSLNVKAPSGEYRAAIFETESLNGPSVQIKGSKTYELRSTNSGAGEGAGLFFIYDKDNEQRRLQIDASGRVTMPSQPSFSAGRNAGAVNGATGFGTEIVFNSVNHDTGSNYNSSTGRFTAPVAGKYYFSTMGMLDTVTDASNADIQLRIGKNGSMVLSSNPPVESGNQQGMGFAASLVLDLAAGDYVSCSFYSSVGSASKFYGGGSQYNNFSGFLIG